jgi:indolepyruvate ferredoxin oxidoreductase beta subunit
MPVLIGQASYPHDAPEALRRAVGAVSVVPAAKIAEELGNIRVQNLCLLGALARLLALENADWDARIAAAVPPRTVELNRLAFARGYAFA